MGLHPCGHSLLFQVGQDRQRGADEDEGAVPAATKGAHRAGEAEEGRRSNQGLGGVGVFLYNLIPSGDESFVFFMGAVRGCLSCSLITVELI